MQVEEILKIESRDPNNINKIYLIKDNESSPWYKAYEWSAYLLEFFPNGLKDEERLKPTRKKVKNYDVINVGLQLTSITKYCPGITPNASNPMIITIDINLASYDVSYLTYTEKMNDWKNSISIKQSQVKNNIQQSTNVVSQPTTFMSIMKEILKFQLYGKSEQDLVQFIENLKDKCADLIC